MMQLSNLKLVDRGVRMIMESIPVTREVAEELLEKNGSVRKAVEAYKG